MRGSADENLIIRQADRQDLPGIVDIYNSTIPSRMVTADTQAVTVAMKEKWFQEHNPHSRPIWIVERNGMLIGWLSFQSFYGRPAYQATAEVSIYVAQERRGGGIGKYLLEKAITACPEYGIQRLLGFIFGHNEPSIQLFTRFGFQIWGNLPGVANLDGVERDLLILGKKI